MPKFRTFQQVGGAWRWHLIADNGEKVATSGESFYSRENVKRAAQTVKRLAGGASVE